MDIDYSEYKRMVKALLDDVRKSLKYHIDKDNQFWRRTYIRTVSAFIEAITFHFKRLILNGYDKGVVDFNSAELALLREESYELNDKGDATKQQRFIPIAKNFRFVCKAFARYKQSSYKLKVDDSGWGAFKNFIEIRNRLMHPKTALDLDISDIAMKSAEKAFVWFGDISKELLKLKPGA